MAKLHLAHRWTPRAVVRLLRASPLCLATVLLATCAEAPIDPGRAGVGVLSLAPVFPASAYTAGLVLDNVRLVVVRPPTTTLIDRAYAFPANQSRLQISESIELLAESEQLQVTLTCLSGLTPLYSGSALVEVRQGSGTGEPIALQLGWVGPGDQVATIAIAPRDTVLTFDASLAFRVAAADGQGQSVTQFYVSWQSSDPGQSPDGAGILRAGRGRMVLRITAATPAGVRDSTTVTIVPPPTRLSLTGGNNQTAQVGTRLPQLLEVEVRGDDDLPVPGASVTFAAPGGGVVESPNGVTDAGGRASTGATLGPVAGQQSFTATVAGAGSVSFTATATQVPLPTVSFTAATQTAAEGGAVTITARLSSTSTQPVTVPFAVGGTATSPADYTITSTPLMIPAGSTTAAVTVTVVGDGVAEPDETVIVTLGTPTNATLGTPAVHTVTITGQVPTVSFTAASQGATEGTTATITAQLSSTSTQAVTVPFSVGGTAATPADYTITATPLVIAAGNTTGTITVTVVADGVAEPDETVITTLGTPTNATLGATTAHTLTITGQVPTVSFTAASQGATEGTTATITAQLSSTSTQAVTVPFSVGGTAATLADYTITATPLTIPAGSITATITVTILADAVAEPNETVIVTLGTPTNATLGATTVHTLTITGQVPTVSFTAAANSVSENVGTATITLRLSIASTQDVTVPYTLGGTAAFGTDYSVSVASPMVIKAGQTSVPLNLPVVDDPTSEPDETIVVTLGTPAGATLGTPSVHTLTIVDNDQVLTVTLAGRGAGTVATPAGFSPAINCTTGGPPAQCAATYPTGTQVSLTATPEPTSEGIFRFEGWNGTGTGFGCTTSPTCVVLMDQGRQVTARFSTWGTITFVPPSAGFTMVERTVPPAGTTVSVTNTGERQLLLNGTIPITYAPQVTPWLDAKLDRLVVDTLTPATLTLTVLTAASTLPAGTYTADVIVRDDGLQRSWTLPVTLTITPPPTAPTISNIRVSLIQLNDSQICTLSSPAASSFRVLFDYNDPNGNGPTNISQAGLNISWDFLPLHNTGGFTNYTYQSSLTGNGFTGSANTVQCYRFGSNTEVNVTMTIQDQGGLVSPGATFNIQKPAGSN